MGALQAIIRIILSRMSRASRSFEFVRRSGAVLFVLLLVSTGLVAQVKIQERVRITPQVARDSSASLHHPVDTSRWGAPHVLGIPLKRWLEVQRTHSKVRPGRKTSSITSPASVACGDIAAVINPTEIFYDNRDLDTFFTANGTFELPTGPGIRVLLKGGSVQGFGGPPFPMCCIGADDSLNLKINGVEVIAYNLDAAGRAFLDPDDDGIDVTAYVHPGTNTYSVIAIDTRAGYQSLTPLRLRYRGPLDQFLLLADPSYIATGEVARLYAIALDSCGNELTLDNALHLTLEVTAGTVYGSFLTAAGDTVPSPLSDVLYEDLRNGSIGFLANGVVPDSIVAVTIRVTVPGTAIPPAEATILVDAPSCPLIVSMPSQISPGDTAALTVVRRRENGVTDLYPPDQLFDLSINDGVGAGLLVAPDGTTDANSLSCTPGVGNRFAAADSIGGDSVRVEFRAAPVICGESGPSLEGGKLDPLDACTPFGAVVVRRHTDSLDHFLVSLNPDTIKHGEVSTISVLAQGANNHEVAIDDNTILTFTVDNTQYGQLINALGDTLPSPLTNVLYGDARMDRIKFVANGLNPIGVEPSIVSITVMENHARGSGVVVVRENVTIRIALSSGRLRPLGNGDNKPNPDRGDTLRQKVIDFSKVKTTNATVTVVDNQNNPVPNYRFTLEALVRANSGGHDHSADRPTGRLIKGRDTSATVSDTTGTDGRKTYVYLSSGIGGVDILFVRGTTDKDTASATIDLEIAGLGELTDGEHYDLVGETAQHRKNHYGKNNTIQKLRMLADSAFADSSWVLQYNDISLVNGGPFDSSPINYPWDTPHQLHREGIHVDIRPESTGGRRPSADRIRFWVEQRLKGTFEEEFKDKPNHHFHLKF